MKFKLIILIVLGIIFWGFFSYLIGSDNKTPRNMVKQDILEDDYYGTKNIDAYKIYPHIAREGTYYEIILCSGEFLILFETKSYDIKDYGWVFFVDRNTQTQERIRGTVIISVRKEGTRTRINETTYNLEVKKKPWERVIPDPYIPELHGDK